ncbi:hypothetical protein [Caballeronia sp. J97]|uniref:hypothetical protein n=1 Tax=Caballeronia sp. J97 TaxID=2805429 RepID=UPI002AAFB249|nr:hypothetical protein [Caballeronia sp. J97]
MDESKEKDFSAMAQRVMGDAHTSETIAAMANHAAELAALRRSDAGDLMSIGTRLSECLHLIRAAVVPVMGDNLAANKDAAEKLFAAFLAQSLEMSRAVARQYMRLAEQFGETDLDPSTMTVRELLSRR